MSEQNGVTNDVEKTIAEFEAKRAARKIATSIARDQQYAKDVVEVDRLETELGDDRVKVLHTRSFMAGLPTVVVVKTPDPVYMKRWREKVRRYVDAVKLGGKKVANTGEATDELGLSCVVYPDADTYEKMREAWPGIHDDVGTAAVQLGDSEGKG